MPPTSPNWRTSSYTGTESCIEIADNDPTQIAIRDTKARDTGTIAVDPRTWTAFIEYAKQQ